MNEHGFAKKITSKCREKGLPKIWKVNDNYAGGAPDAWFLGNKTDLWIEFKWIPALPKKQSTMIIPKLSAQQLSWLKALHACGRPVWVVVGAPKVAFVLPSPTTWTGGFAPIAPLTHGDLVEMIVDKVTLG